MMSAPKDTKFVDIGDALLSNDDLTCLTRDAAFLPDDVSQHSLKTAIYTLVSKMS